MLAPALDEGMQLPFRTVTWPLPRGPVVRSTVDGRTASYRIEGSPYRHEWRGVVPRYVREAQKGEAE